MKKCEIILKNKNNLGVISRNFAKPLKFNIMKKIILFAIILMGIEMNALSQQVCLSDTVNYYEFISGTQIKEIKGRSIYVYDANSHLTSQVNQNWNVGTNSFDNAYKFLYSYDANGNLITYISQNWDSGTNTWVNNYMYTNTYNANNLVTQNISKIWDNLILNWVNSSNYLYTYDGNNNNISYVAQSWDGVISSWMNGYKSDMTYDMNNNMTQHLTQYWDNIGSFWYNSDRTLYSYNASNLVSNYLYQIWNSSTNTWDNSNKSDYSYDANNDNVQTVYSNWNTSSSTWELSSKYTVTYNSNHMQLSQLYQWWDLVSSVWMNSSLVDYTYNASNLMTEFSFKSWNGSAWDNVYKYTQEYDANDALTAFDYYSSWNSSGQYYQYHIRNEYLFHCVSTAGIVEIEKNTAFDAYPNPADELLTVKTDKLGVYTINDLAGKTVKVIDIATSPQAIDVRDLQPGFYFIKKEGDSYLEKIQIK